MNGVYNQWGKIMQTVNFFVESVKNLKTVGALAACSPTVAERMTKPVDFTSTTFLVELGGGTGAITTKILAQMRSDAELVVFEINPVFVETLKNLNDPRLTVVNDSALNLADYLASRGIQKVDYIISTLPISLMERRTRAKLLTEVMNVLDERGRFMQVQYSLISKREIEQKFPAVKLDFTLLNFPPVFFYICGR